MIGNRWFSSLSLLVVMGVSFVVFSGCQTTVPQSDGTPPSLQLTLIENGNIKEINSDTTKTVSKKADVKVVASANDPEGVKSLVLRGEGHKKCGEGEFVTDRPIGNGYSVSDRAAPSTGPGDSTTDTRLVHLDVPTDCQDKKLAGINLNFQATAENFHGGTEKSHELTLVVP